MKASVGIVIAEIIWNHLPVQGRLPMAVGGVTVEQAMTSSELSDSDIQGLTSGIILAGGVGRRVGGRDKGLLQWREHALVAHVARRLQPQVGTVIISCNRHLADYQQFGFTTVRDGRGGFQGPLAGVEAAAPYVLSPFVIVVGCDTPLLPLDLARRLLAPLLESDCEISHAHDGSRDQYLFAALRSSCLPAVSGYLDQGQRSVGGWYRSRRCAVVDFSDCPLAFSNFNQLD